MRNRFSSICRTCRNEVPIGGGELEGGSGAWTVTCDDCRARRNEERAAREAELLAAAQAQSPTGIVPRARIRTVAVQEAQQREQERVQAVEAATAREQEQARLAVVREQQRVRGGRRGLAAASEEAQSVRPRAARPVLMLRVENLVEERPQSAVMDDDTFASLFLPERRQRQQTTQENRALSPDERQLAQNYRSQGYRVISRAKLLIARIDKHDWKYQVPRGDRGQATAEDYFRRNLSKDVVTLSNKYLLTAVGGSTIKLPDSEPGFVNMDPDFKPERKVKRRGMEL